MADIIYTIPFADCKVSIDCRNSVAEQIVTFLFPKAKKESSGNDDPVFLLKSSSQEKREQFLFYENDQEVFRSHETGVMAAMVLDAVVSWFAGECRVGPTLHAAALMMDDQCGVLLPGKSGSGKSTLSAWMTHHGYGYLTDELACLPGDTHETLLGFPRPIHLKKSMAEYFGKIVSEGAQQENSNCIEGVLKSNQGLLVPAEQLNPGVTKEVPLKPIVAAIVFPTFQKSANCQVEPISSAQSFARMMGTVVNARNFDDHAVKSIAQLTRDIPSFVLTFGQLEAVIPNLEPVMQKVLSL